MDDKGPWLEKKKRKRTCYTFINPSEEDIFIVLGPFWDSV